MSKSRKTFFVYMKIEEQENIEDRRTREYSLCLKIKRHGNLNIGLTLVN